MEQQQEEHSCLVVWRGQKFVVQINPNATFKELGEKLQELTNVGADTMRLLVPVEKSSKMIYPFSDEHAFLSLDSTSAYKGKSLRMMGVPKDEIDEVLKNAKMDFRIAGFEEEEKRLKQRSLDRAYTLRKLPQGTYIFCDFQTLNLPGVQLNPPASKALELLHQLASDPGIVEIMNKHRWRVGLLSEMAPVGYVGVSPLCVLGVNKNHGEEISLRLRTDDLKGFRKYETIRKTLLHELAHMVFSEHDANFRALDSQLNKEAAALDWTKSSGHTLTRVAHSQHYENEFNMSSNMPASHKLGGQTSSLPDARASSVNAAFQRLANFSRFEDVFEPDPDDRESDTSMVSQRNHNNREPHNIIDPLPTPETGRYEESNFVDLSVSPIGTDSYVPGEPDPDDSHAEKRHIKPGLGEENPTNQKVEPDPDDSGLQRIPMSQTVEPDPDDSELQIIQDPVTMVCGRLQNAIQSLKYEVRPSEIATVVQTLIKIICNVIEHPDDMKFKKLRKANPMIQRNILCYKAAVDILSLVGFCEDVVANEDGNAEAYLALKRNDPGLLWLAKSSLETSIV